MPDIRDLIGLEVPPILLGLYLSGKVSLEEMRVLAAPLPDSIKRAMGEREQDEY